MDAHPPALCHVHSQFPPLTQVWALQARAGATPYLGAPGVSGSNWNMPGNQQACLLMRLNHLSLHFDLLALKPVTATLRIKLKSEIPLVLAA